MVINTLALYVKIGVICVVQLLATRIALRQLGADSFGLYNLIAGVIVLLSFLNGALMISVQRYLSIAIGEGNEKKMNTIFNVSLKIHFSLAVVVSLFFLLLRPFLFNGFLSIPEDLSETAVTVYNLMIISSAVTLLTIPYASCMNAREDMWCYALTEIVGGILKLWAAFSLYFFTNNLLLIYTLFMLLSILVSSLLRYLWCRFKYKEARIVFSEMRDKDLTKEILGFVGWNTIGAAAVVSRNQGIAVLLNTFFSTAINAAYGVASQVNSLVLSFSTTLTTVFTPTIIQKKGRGDIEGMLRAAELSSKMSFLLSTIMALPILVYIDDVLGLWLGTPPEQTQELTTWVVISFVITQLTPGLNRAIYACGNLKWYQIWTSICLLSNIPIGYIILKLGFPAYYVIIVMAILQIVSTIITIYYAHKFCTLKSKSFLINSVLKPASLFACVILFAYFLDRYVVPTSNIIVVLFISIFLEIIYVLGFVFLVLNKTELNTLKNVILKNKTDR